MPAVYFLNNTRKDFSFYFFCVLCYSALSASFPAYASCPTDTATYVPVVTNINATSNSISVSWLLSCTPLPQKVDLERADNGQIMGTTALSALQQTGVTTASGLAPSTRYFPLKLCATYTNGAVECSGVFAAPTNGPQPTSVRGPGNLRVADASRWVSGTHWQPEFDLV